MNMARKFKKRLAHKQIRSKTKPVLSISLIRKEYLEKVRQLLKRFTKFIKATNHQLITKN